MGHKCLWVGASAIAGICHSATAMEPPKFGADFIYHYNSFSGSLFEDGADSIGYWRRARASVKQEFTPWLSIKASTDYEYDDRKFELTDLYLQLSLSSDWYLLLGRFKEPFSMENLQSVKEQYLTERSAPGEALTFGRNAGAGIFYERKRWTWAAAVTEVESEDEDYNDVYAATSRATFAPVLEDDYFVHLGAGYTQRDINEKNYQADANIIATGADAEIKSPKIKADDVQAYNLELAAQWHRVLMQAETFKHEVDARNGEQHNLTGHYVALVWTLTGKERSYNKGVIDIGKGNHITELAVRYSKSDFEVEGDGDRGDTRALAINYYPRPAIRLSLEYEYGKLYAFDEYTREVSDGESFNGRLQYLF